MNALQEQTPTGTQPYLSVQADPSPGAAGQEGPPAGSGVDCQMVSLLIVEDDDLLRDLLVETLSAEADLRVVGSVADGGKALELVRTHQPRVVLLDLHLPDVTGFAVLERLSALPEAPQVLVFSADNSVATQVEAARMGARGYLAKSHGATRLPDAIRAVAHTGCFFSPDAQKQIIDDYRDLSQKAREQNHPLNRLTEREREVLLEVARGYTNKQIATTLFMSVHTVKLHVQNLLRKLGLPNRTEAAVFAVREGLLDGDEGAPSNGG